MAPTSTIPIPTYGRRQGRKLRAGKRALVDELLPELVMGDAGEALAEYPEWWLEIGFGGGEHLAHQAANHSAIGMIGCEPYLNGVGDLLRRISAGNIENIRLFKGDARLLMAQLPPASLTKAFILFPDPWPKSRHHKRRLITTAFLEELAVLMKPGAELLIATDHEDYLTWILSHALACKSWQWQALSAADWQNPPAEWVETKYQKKALCEGRQPHFLRFVRREAVRLRG